MFVRVVPSSIRSTFTVGSDKSMVVRGMLSWCLLALLTFAGCTWSSDPADSGGAGGTQGATTDPEQDAPELSHTPDGSVESESAGGGMAAATDDPEVIAQLEAWGVKLTRNAEGRVVRADCEPAALTDEQALLLAELPMLVDVSLEKSSITDAGLEELLQRVPQLTALGLRRCSLLTDDGFAALRHLPKLERAFLLYTNISDAGLVHVAPLTQLRVLDLRGCPRLGNAGLQHLSGLVNLVDLKLRGSGFYDTGLAHLSGMTRMRFLTLEDASVTDAGMAHLAGMTDLRQLNVNRTYVSDNALQHFSEMKQLQDLRLRQTAFTGPGLDHLPSEVERSLTFLDLSEIRISDVGLAHASRFVNLKTLDLWNGSVTDEGLAHLSGMTQLETLNLDSCPVTSAGMVHLVGLTQLKTLNLSRTRIDDAALDQLSVLSGLQRLDIANTPEITPEGLARFQSALPNCRIEQ